jgi:hypothetical protein
MQSSGTIAELGQGFGEQGKSQIARTGSMGVWAVLDRESQPSSRASREQTSRAAIEKKNTLDFPAALPHGTVADR